MPSRRTILTALTAAPIARLFADDAPDWGGPVIDIHLHPKQGPDGEFTHMKGCGVTRAVLLTPERMSDHARKQVAAHPGKFVWFASANTAKDDAVTMLRASAKNGAIGFGELKSQVACDGPEMRRVYDLAAELQLPVLLHFQEVTQPNSPGTFNMGLRNLAAILEKYPKTTFIGHADFFWANISAEVSMTDAYPEGKIKKGGLTDRMLSDYPNLYGDISANSGRNALSRDPEFTADFLKRHQNKLMFGSDCSCTDGRGTGQRSQAAALQGKCVARETLAVVKKHASPEIFRKIAWTNATRLLHIR